MYNIMVVLGVLAFLCYLRYNAQADFEKNLAKKGKMIHDQKQLFFS